MQHEPKVLWALRPVTVVVAILVIGPFALPLVWISPSFTRSQKVIITIFLILFSIWLLQSSVRLYSLLMAHMQELQRTLNP